MKKHISFLLVIVMALSINVYANTNGSMDNFNKINTYKEGQFYDVPSSEWYAENVKTAYELGLVNGTSTITFSPYSNLTIAEAITLASRLHNIYYGNTYSFVSGEVWYQTYVDYAISNRIIYSDSYRNFDAFATRSQFAQIFAKALPDDALMTINQVADNSIPDVDMQSSYSGDVYKLYRAGILTGNDEKGTFTPNTNIQRCAVAAIISRMANANLRQHITLNNPDSGKLPTSEEIYSLYSPAVFYIDVLDSYGDPFASGSGFFIDESGIAVTNYHVIEGASAGIITIPASQKTYDIAGVYCYNKEQDWAVIQVRGSGFPYLEIGSDKDVHVGQKVYTIGSPLGLQNTISEGLLSNKYYANEYVNYYQISAPISSGSSGGALLNEKGQVIGITTMEFIYGQNLNHAVPMHYVTLNFDRSKYKTLVEVMNENDLVPPPKNIRVVKQEDDKAYIQWDKVNNADYYYLYYQEYDEEYLWYDGDEYTDEPYRLQHAEEYSGVITGLEYGKVYNVFVVSVKNGVESEYSRALTFEFTTGSKEKMLRDLIKSNCDSFDGICYKLEDDFIIADGVYSITSLVYDEQKELVYIECIASTNEGNTMLVMIYLDDAKELSSIIYMFLDPLGGTASGTLSINPKSFKDGNRTIFEYYDNNSILVSRANHQGACSSLMTVALKGANHILYSYGQTITLSDFGFVNF